jgi:signal transduction histidine kinase
MTVDELVQHLSRGVFFLLLGVTAYHYYVHRDNIRRDIFLVFLALSTGNGLRLIFSLVGIDPLPPYIAIIGQMALVAQPFLTIRLLTYFRSVPQWVLTSAAVILTVNWLALIFLAVAEETVEQSTLVSAFIAFNFAFFNGYAVWAFVSGAFSTAGVVSQRLRFAAAGSAFVAIVIGSAGINLLFPATRAFTLPLVQFFSILAGLSFFLGFAPPQWLRQAWQSSELRQYLQDSQQSNGNAGSMVKRLTESVTRGLGTNVIDVKVALWDDAREKLIVQETGEVVRSSHKLLLSPTIEQAWESQSPIVLLEKSIETAEDVKMMSLRQAKSMLAVPITTNEQSLGMLIVFLQHGSLFVEEDLALLQIFAQQAAIVLQNQRMVDQLYERNEDLEQKVLARTADLQRSNEELKMFAYVASHDLQEPLRTISSYLQLIEARYNDKLDSDGHEFIAFAVDGAARMKELIQDVLAYSRVETQPKNFTEFSSQEAIDEVCRLLELSINEAQAIITCDDMPQIKADRRLVIQLFQNLVGNAIKYRGDLKPEVHVGCVRENGSWHFSVKDNGIGIEPQYLEQIFVVFRRLHHRGTYTGTGIGLAICKKAVELHGGRIWVESTPGQGSTFHFTLPVEPIED